jgi:hypothetical protein
MDTYRGSLADHGAGFASDDSDFGDDEIGRESPPLAIGQDERRMQVRAYNHWASLLDDRSFPAVEALKPENLPDFGPFSVLLDFTKGIDNPAIPFLGHRLAEECAAEGVINELNDVPSRSLLSRITDHYMQILANQAPIGFEAEFVNQFGKTVLYRGILLPFSSDDATIDFIYGVINWKELADQQTTDELLLEIDQALEAPVTIADHGEATPAPLELEPLTEWADGPDDILDLTAPLDLTFPLEPTSDDLAWPEPLFGETEAAAPYADFDLGTVLPEVFDVMPSESVPDTGEMALADWLASARELALAAQGSEDRTRHALYAAIGRAYDFSLAAAEAPAEFDELVADSGLTVQDRAPMTPVVKLVFGADYDKTRLTEYASALSHATRVGVGRGELAGYLGKAPGGLKGIVAEERRRRREEGGKPANERDTPREALARKLRKLDHAPLATIAPEGSEFTVLVARRLPTGEVVLLGEIADDVPLLERVARRLLD